MSNSKSRFLRLSKKFKFLRGLYYFYNIYIRNFKYLKNSSQFGEDKFISGLFEKNFKGKYLDIGCYHPTRHNNTYLMYKKGWRGINIDLNPLSIQLFVFFRPEDINIQSGISNTEEEKKLYFIGELNTQNTIDENHLNFLRKNHNIKDSDITERTIQTKNLNSILEKYNYYDIDFMNLDIEGQEYKVLQTIDFKKVNIKYLCVEMIEHNEKSIDNNQKIKKLLFNNNYELIKNFDYSFIYKKID